MGRRRLEEPHAVDVHVGGRLRLRRKILGMSQSRLGECVGLSLQQIQKYEQGRNRITASRLHQFTEVLDVPVSFFFDGMADATVQAVCDKPAPASTSGCCQGSGLETSQAVIKFIASFYNIKDPRVRRRIVSLMRALGNDLDGGKEQ